MTRSQASSAYRQTQTQTATREQAVVLLFEGIVKYLHQARAAMLQARYEEQSQAIAKAQRVLSELTAALSETPDAELAGSLRCSYTVMYNRLVQANISDDVVALDEVTRLAEGFAGAWRGALEHISGDGSLAAAS